MFARKLVILVTAAFAIGAAGCAWETGDESVYYQHNPQHQIENDPSGTGKTPNQDVAADPGTVQAGATQGPLLVPATGTTQSSPEPQPWMEPSTTAPVVHPPKWTETRIP